MSTAVVDETSGQNMTFGPRPNSQEEEFLHSSSDVKTPPSEKSTPSSPNPSEMGDSTDSFSELSTLDGEEMSEELLLENRCFQELETQKTFAKEAENEIIVQDINVAIDALLKDFENLDAGEKKKIRQFEHEINSSHVGWIRLSVENDINILAGLLFDWIQGLKVPVIKMENFETIVIFYKQPEVCFKKFSVEECYLMEYLLRFLSKLQPISKECQEDLLKRLIGALSKHSVLINGQIIPSGKGFKKLGDGTFTCAFQFFQSILELVEQHHSQKPNLFTLEDKISDNESDVENGFQ